MCANWDAHRDRRQTRPYARSSEWDRRGSGRTGAPRILGRSTSRTPRPDGATLSPAPPPGTGGRCDRRSVPVPTLPTRCGAGSECSGSSPRPAPARRAQSERRRTSSRRFERSRARRTSVSPRGVHPFLRNRSRLIRRRTSNGVRSRVGDLVAVLQRPLHSLECGFRVLELCASRLRLLLTATESTVRLLRFRSRSLE
jgi:hypothetical protein